MRDFSAPIRCVIAVGVTVLMLVLASAVFAADASPSIRAAIERSVRDRMGAVAEVRVDNLTSEPAELDGVAATPEPGARTAAPARFILWSQGRRVGNAVATVTIRTKHVRADRALARDEAVSAADVVSVVDEIGSVALKRLPSEADVVGSHPKRAIAPGEVLTTGILTQPPAIKTGDAIRLTLTMGDVQVTGRAIAFGTGQIGDVIRIRSVGGRRLLSARITAPGAVEVIQ